MLESRNRGREWSRERVSGNSLINSRLIGFWVHVRILQQGQNSGMEDIWLKLENGKILMRENNQ